MSTEPKATCPKCGAGAKKIKSMAAWCVWACGSGPEFQSDACRVRELEAQLTAERARAEATVCIKCGLIADEECDNAGHPFAKQRVTTRIIERTLAERDATIAELRRELNDWRDLYGAQDPSDGVIGSAVGKIVEQRNHEIANLRALIHDLTQPSRVVEELSQRLENTVAACQLLTQENERLRQRVAELEAAADAAAWDRASNESLNRVDPPASREGDR